jgi:hypothetical protein
MLHVAVGVGFIQNYNEGNPRKISFCWVTFHKFLYEVKFKLTRMKNSLKIALVIGFLAGSGVALTFCSSKTEKPVEDAQDTVQVDTVQNPVDSTAQEASQDTTAAQ